MRATRLLGAVLLAGCLALGPATGMAQDLPVQGAIDAVLGVVKGLVPFGDGAAADEPGAGQGQGALERFAGALADGKQVVVTMEDPRADEVTGVAVQAGEQPHVSVVELGRASAYPEGDYRLIRAFGFERDPNDGVYLWLNPPIASPIHLDREAFGALGRGVVAYGRELFSDVTFQSVWELIKAKGLELWDSFVSGEPEVSEQPEEGEQGDLVGSLSGLYAQGQLVVSLAGVDWASVLDALGAGLEFELEDVPDYQLVLGAIPGQEQWAADERAVPELPVVAMELRAGLSADELRPIVSQLCEGLASDPLIGLGSLAGQDASRVKALVDELATWQTGELLYVIGLDAHGRPVCQRIGFSFVDDVTTVDVSGAWVDATAWADVGQCAYLGGLSMREVGGLSSAPEVDFDLSIPGALSSGGSLLISVTKGAATEPFVNATFALRGAWEDGATLMFDTNAQVETQDGVIYEAAPRVGLAILEPERIVGSLDGRSLGEDDVVALIHMLLDEQQDDGKDDEQGAE